jgi:hypothetical protein
MSVPDALVAKMNAALRSIDSVPQRRLAH